MADGQDWRVCMIGQILNGLTKLRIAKKGLEKYRIMTTNKKPNKIERLLIYNGYKRKEPDTDIFVSPDGRVEIQTRVFGGYMGYKIVHIFEKHGGAPLTVKKVKDNAEIDGIFDWHGIPRLKHEPKLTAEVCRECEFSSLVMKTNIRHLGCHHPPHKGTWVMKLKKCPKDTK